MVLLPNTYVLGTSLFAYAGIYATGMLSGSLNGILEMQGFQLTFHELYGGTGGGGESLERNYSYPNDTDQTPTCGSGNGASSDILIGMFVAVFNITQIVGFLLSSWIADRFSRKYSLVIGGLCLALGCAVLASSFFLWTLYISRIIHGLAIGILYMMCSLYVAETTPKEVRGMMTSITGPSFNAGLVTGIFTNVGFSQFFVGWRIAAIVVMLIALLFCFGMKFMPHTPRWLVKKGREKEALLVLTKINKHSKKETLVDTYLELEDIKESIQNTDLVDKWVLWRDLYHLKFRLLLIMVLFLLGSSSGFFVLYYSTTTFCVVGVPPFTAGVALGFILLIGGMVPTVLADKVGRKPILVFFATVNFVAGITAGVLTQLYGSSNDTVAYTVVFLICVYAFGYSASWLSLPWVIAAESFPNNVRGLTFGISCVSFGLFGFVLNQLTPIIIGSPLRLHGFLYLVSMETLVAGLFVFFALPETKAVSLESMDKIFSQSCWENVKQFLRCSMLKKSITPDGKVDLDEIKVVEIKQGDWFIAISQQK